MRKEPFQWIGDLPMKKIAFTASLFSLYVVFLRIGMRGKLVDGSMSVMLLQAVIPVSILLHVLLMKDKYTWKQYLGAIIIMIGVGVSVGPSVRSLSFASLIAMGTLLLSTVPFAGAYLMVQIILKNFEVHILVMWLWIYVFQSIFTLPLATIIIPLAGVKWRDVPQNIDDGLQCLILMKNKEKGDTCDDALLWFSLFAVAVVSHGLAQGSLCYAENSALMWVATTVAVPLSFICFMLPFISGEPFSLYNVVGLFIVVFGLILFRFLSYSQQQQQGQSDKGAIFGEYDYDDEDDEEISGQPRFPKPGVGPVLELEEPQMPDSSFVDVNLETDTED